MEFQRERSPSRRSGACPGLPAWPSCRARTADLRSRPRGRHESWLLHCIVVPGGRRDRLRGDSARAGHDRVVVRTRRPVVRRCGRGGTVGLQFMGADATTLLVADLVPSLGLGRSGIPGHRGSGCRPRTGTAAVAQRWPTWRWAARLGLMRAGSNRIVSRGPLSHSLCSAGGRAPAMA